MLGKPPLIDTQKPQKPKKPQKTQNTVPRRPSPEIRNKQQQHIRRPNPHHRPIHNRAIPTPQNLHRAGEREEATPAGDPTAARRPLEKRTDNRLENMAVEASRGHRGGRAMARFCSGGRKSLGENCRGAGGHAA